MGQSFDSASEKKSKAQFNGKVIYDTSNHFCYSASKYLNKIYITEFRREKKDTTFKRIEKVDFIIGSGQHTNSHIQNVNGYLNQMPLTFYTQKQTWDLPPGFENGNNTRFGRKIGLECMSCHNAYPAFVEGSENKYSAVPSGIDCERCHGPGSIHVALKMNGQIIDTATQIDYSIVNPAKLPVDLQFDICQRCHLQGNAVLKKDKSFYDFKPGQKLNEVMTVFLPKYANADKDFIMASHADRLKQSACFIKTSQKTNGKSLKPYRDALTCVTCHNPHVSVRETNNQKFNQACINCHGKTEEALNKLNLAHKKESNNFMSSCVTCHMPSSGSIDIPHVSVHDHYIRKPISTENKQAIKKFLGLYAINEKNPEPIVKAEAYINQFEKFDNKMYYLDSAANILQNLQGKEALGLKIRLSFIRKNFQNVITLVENESKKNKNLEFNNKSLTNNDAWTCYRIAESYNYLNKNKEALPWIQKAANLAPYNIEFRNKLAGLLAASNNWPAAENEWRFILKENPKFVPAYTNLGYIKMQQNEMPLALQFFNQGMKLDPDNESLLLNLVSYYFKSNNRTMAVEYLQKLIKAHPENAKAKAALSQLNYHG